MKMSIRPISSVSFNNYNSLAFEGRKNKEHHNNASNPVSHKLVVPTAALMLAMMPSNAASVPEWEIENRIEYSQECDIDNLDDAATYRMEPQENKRKVLQRANVLDASPRYGKCLMELVTDDGGKTGKIMLNFQEIEKYSKGRVREKNTIYSLELDTLKTRTNVSIDGKTSFDSYYICGPTKVISKTANEKGEYGDEYVKIHPNMNIEITKEFFDNLRGFVGDLIPHVNERHDAVLDDILY